MNHTFQFNTCKIQRWVIQALLADVDLMKFAFVARQKPGKIDKHVILQTFTRTTAELVKDQGINMKQSWGYLKFFVDEIYKRADQTGDYMIYKDPTKMSFRLY